MEASSPRPRRPHPPPTGPPRPSRGSRSSRGTTPIRALEAAEQELIFERTWQLAGHVSQLAGTGSYITAAAGNQPVLVVRDEKGGLRAYRNVCRHRGSRLLSGSGQCKAAIRCRYHGWTYKMDGSLIGVPEGMQFGEKLDKPHSACMPVRVEEMCGLVFVNLDNDAAPLAEMVGDLPQRLAPYRIETLDAVRARARRYPAGQLEGGGRQLHRGLPHPHRPPGPDADARLQAL